MSTPRERALARFEELAGLLAKDPRDSLRADRIRSVAAELDRLDAFNDLEMRMTLSAMVWHLVDAWPGRELTAKQSTARANEARHEGLTLLRECAKQEARKNLVDGNGKQRTRAAVVKAILPGLLQTAKQMRRIGIRGVPTLTADRAPRTVGDWIAAVVPATRGLRRLRTDAPA